MNLTSDELVAIHAEQRAKERYGIELSEADREDMVNQVKGGRGLFFKKKDGSSKVSIWLVWWNAANRIVPVYYKAGRVLTVLPTEAFFGPDPSPSPQTPALSEWSGWDQSNLPWSQAKHQDAVCRAVFGPTWAMEDAGALIGFIDRTWGGSSQPPSPQSVTAPADYEGKLSDFLDALDEWGCEDNSKRAEQIIEFQRTGYDLDAYLVDHPDRPKSELN